VDELLACRLQLLELDHCLSFWHQLVKLNRCLEFLKLDIERSILFQVVIVEMLEEGLFSAESIRGRLSFLVLLDLNHLYITVGNSDDGHVSKWCVLCTNCLGLKHLLPLIFEFQITCLFFFIGSFTNFFRKHKINWSSTIFVLVDLIDLEQQVEGASILGEGKRLCLCAWIVRHQNNLVNHVVVSFNFYRGLAFWKSGICLLLSLYLLLFLLTSGSYSHFKELICCCLSEHLGSSQSFGAVTFFYDAFSFAVIDNFIACHSFNSVWVKTFCYILFDFVAGLCALEPSIVYLEQANVRLGQGCNVGHINLLSSRLWWCFRGHSKISNV
jgi:hypothetical protein